MTKTRLLSQCAVVALSIGAFNSASATLVPHTCSQGGRILEIVVNAEPANFDGSAGAIAIKYTNAPDSASPGVLSGDLSTSASPWADRLLAVAMTAYLNDAPVRITCDSSGWIGAIRLLDYTD
jgi:hypothetical protein